MNKAPLERPRKSRRWDNGAYTCADGVRICCNCDVLKIYVIKNEILSRRIELTAPVNGILLRSDEPHVAIDGMLMSRDMKEIIRGAPVRTYALPSTTITVGKNAFFGNKVTSIRLNEGLRVLEKKCLELSGIRKLILPSSI